MASVVVRRGQSGGVADRTRAMLAMLVVLLAALPATAGMQRDLQRDLERAVAQAGLDGLDVGVSVVDLRTGRRIVDIDAYDPLIPASNMKVLTSATALMTLGDSFMFDTRFLLVDDALVIVGSGDPGLGDPALLADMPEPMDVDALLDFVADAIMRADPGAIREIVIDDRVFDRDTVHEDWPENQLQYYYCAEVGGLNFHLNIVNVFARDTSLNQPARIVLEPDASSIEIENKTRTAARRTPAGRPHQSAISIARDEAGNRWRVSGEVSRSVGAPTAVRDTAIVFGELLAERLEHRGVEIGDAHALPGEAVRRAEADERFEGEPLLVIKTPIAEVLKRCNRDSYNLHAEALFKRIGHEITRQPGSWVLGAAGMRQKLTDALGPTALDGLRVADGSGMSRDNKISPATLTSLLAHMHVTSDESARVLFRDSLARSGEGTLRRGFLSPASLQHDVLAKTGYLNHVRTISGYVVPKGSSEPIAAFSILMNGFNTSDGLRSRELRNEMVRLIDRKAAELGRVVVRPGTP
ncbi:MAG: D-alanyl-D-alanine carboxypeptidase/D-alanyl-D-alanine-endopeptidase [Phycisphaerales bacterium]|jgi:D-alanyl-D-alanine carboxypeptidase/D-alanyl-D-alanine-endopeptidase (penicillin-binding protein 4)